MKITYQVKGMHCNACVEKIRSALNSFGNCEVSLNPPQVIITSDSPVELTTLNQALLHVGKYQLSETNTVERDATTSKSWFQTYLPLLLIVSVIAVTSLRTAQNSSDWMLNFMAGFFIVFATFKLFDLKGFQNTFSSYDLLAKHYSAYALCYPFIELSLGFAFLFRYQITFTLYTTLAVMTVGSLGVIQALRNKQAIRCACLGTALNLPMSTVTLIEDLVMLAMAITMLR